MAITVERRLSLRLLTVTYGNSVGSKWVWSLVVTFSVSFVHPSPLPVDHYCCHQQPASQPASLRCYKFCNLDKRAAGTIEKQFVNCRKPLQFFFSTVFKKFDRYRTCCRCSKACTTGIDSGVLGDAVGTCPKIDLSFRSIQRLT